MTDILTVTLNPAVDVAASVEHVVAGPKLRCANQTLDPGGGGVNVTRAVQLLGGRSEAFVAVAGSTGRLLVELLEGEGIRPIRFETGGLTRQSFSVTEGASDAQFRFVMQGPVWGADLVTSLFHDLEKILRPGMWVVASGSLPPGLPADTYVGLGALIRRAGAQMILDTSGEALLTAAKPDNGRYHLLRLDGQEAETLAGRSFDTARDLALFARELVESGVSDCVVLGLRAKGSVGVSADEMVYCRPPKVKPVSTVGAGDSLVAAVTLGLARGWPFRQAVAYGTAAAASAVTTPATRLCDPVTTGEYARLIEISDL